MNHTQDNFASLYAAEGHHTGLGPLVDLSTISGGHGATKKTFVDNTNPASGIDSRVYAMLAAWEACEITRKKFEQAEESTMESNSNYVLGPLRCTPTFAPPKRFYVTFWRSVTRRMVAQTRRSIESDVVGSDRSGCEN
jgi:hypothetical protein